MFDTLPPRERVAYDEHWRVAHATGTTIPGWLVLLPRRHVMELFDLSPAEAATLGEWQRRLAVALSREIGAAKVYVSEFGEAPGFHLHFHVVPRAVDLVDDRKGPRIFGQLARAADAITDEQMDAVGGKLSRRLTVEG